MSENLFEAWGALQGSLARLGDAAIRAGEVGNAALENPASGIHATADERAGRDLLVAAERYHRAHLRYQELRGKS